MLELRNLFKSFGSQLVVNDISVTLAEGQTLVIIGPSGCGKSTLLSIIAGLIQPDNGEVLWNGQSLVEVPTHERSFGLMFQDYALFPHLNVADNVAFGLHASDRLTLASESLERVGLAGFEKRDVQTLSGGEQQRVALARALAPRPRLLMLDEPLGALDRALREQLTVELRELLHDNKQTAIYVTHDQQEAFGIADSVMVMRAGQIEQIDAPEVVYNTPANEWVKNFLGPGRLVEGEIGKGADGQAEISTSVGVWPLPAHAESATPGDKVVMLLRAEGVRRR